MDKVWDLEKDHKFSNDINKNLSIVHQTLGTHFNLVLGKYSLPVQLHFINKGELKFYQLIYYDPTYEQETFSPLRIEFVNEFTGKVDGCVAVDAIKKTDTIPGKEMVNIAIKLCKILRCKKLYLMDRATIHCNNIDTFDLSMMKLLESGKTFYEECGFIPSIDQCNFVYVKHFSLESLMKRRSYLIGKIRNTKIKDIISLYNESIELLRMQGTKVFSIYKSLGEHEIFAIKSNNWPDYIDSVISSYTEIIRTMNVSKKELLGEYLIDMSRLNCDKYSSIMKFILDQHNIIYLIKNGDKSIKHEYILYLDELKSIKNDYYYEYMLN
jgi:hypothetical protein